MNEKNLTRRDTLRTFGAGALAALGTALTAPVAQASVEDSAAPVPRPSRRRARILMDGHVHVTNKTFWLGIDTWEPSPTGTGWDYLRAHKAGVNVIIENFGTYGYWSYNITPKQMLRMFEVFHRFAESHRDRMAVALTVEDARRIVHTGRMAVFLSCESGWDQEGDLDVLRAFYRLGLRAVQFSSQSGFNAYSDVQAGLPSGGAHWGGINDRGRAIIEEMNALGILIDITHASTDAQRQIVAASASPVVASHVAAEAVSGSGGLPDDLIVALAKKGGMMGIHGGSASVGVRYRQWIAENPDRYAQLSPFSPSAHRSRVRTSSQRDNGTPLSEFRLVAGSPTHGWPDCIGAACEASRTASALNSFVSCRPGRSHSEALRLSSIGYARRAARTRRTHSPPS